MLSMASLAMALGFIPRKPVTSTTDWCSQIIDDWHPRARFQKVHKIGYCLDFCYFWSCWVYLASFGIVLLMRALSQRPNVAQELENYLVHKRGESFFECVAVTLRNLTAWASPPRPFIFQYGAFKL